MTSRWNLIMKSNIYFLKKYISKKENMSIFALHKTTR